MEDASASLYPAEIGSVIIGGKKHRIWSLIRIPVLSVILMVLLGLVTFHGYIAWTIARPSIAPLTSNPMLAAGLPYEEVEFPSSSGASILEGWYIPSAGATRSVVFSHGYGGNREELWVPFYSLAKELNKEQYNVLLFDYAYVRPEVSATGGVRESQELQGALDYAKAQGNVQNYVWGFSMGAGTALQTALESPDITAMVLDSTFLLEPDTMFMYIRQQIALPHLSLPLIRLFFPLLNGTSMTKIPYERVKHTTYAMPILFIHGIKDAKAPYDIVESIYANQASVKGSSLWLLPNGRHELIFKSNKTEYLKRTISFFRAAG